ncbi:hypothetical protein N7528_005444 [Penicillium herquei]|nr:hypothetical protein N7528_005444 [Penicillium herquei]
MDYGNNTSTTIIQIGLYAQQNEFLLAKDGYQAFEAYRLIMDVDVSMAQMLSLLLLVKSNVATGGYKIVLLGQDSSLLEDIAKTNGQTQSHLTF